MKRAEQTFQEQTERRARSEETLRLVLHSVADGVVVADERGAFLLFNPAAERILGVGGADVAPEEWSARYQLHLPDGVTPYPPEELPLARAIRGEAVDAAEVVVHRTQPPTVIWVSSTARPLRDADGTLRGGVAVFRDVTASKRAEAQLRQAEARYRTLVEQVPAVTFMAALDRDDNELYVSPQIEALLGFSQKEWVEDPVLWYTRLHPDDRER